MTFCCKRFNEECSHEEGIEKQEVWEYDDKLVRTIVEGYVFTFEGCRASPVLEYCPFCGTKLPTRDITNSYPQ